MIETCYRPHGFSALVFTTKFQKLNYHKTTYIYWVSCEVCRCSSKISIRKQNRDVLLSCEAKKVQYSPLVGVVCQFCLFFGDVLFVL